MVFKQAFTGIDVREKVISIASIVIGKKGPIIKHLSQIPTDREWYEGGRVSDPKQLSSILKKSKQDTKKWSKAAHIAIPTQHVILRKINSLPDLPEKELARLIHFEIGESIHLPFDEPIYDFVKVNSLQMNIEEESFDLLAEQAEIQEGMRSRSSVVFIATSKDLSKDLQTSVKEAGFNPISAEIRATALQRLILTLHPTSFKATEAILNIGADSTDLHIFNQGVLEFTRNIAISKSFFMSGNPLSASDQEVAATVEGAAPVEDWDESSYLDDLINEVERAQSFYRYTINQRKQGLRQIMITGDFTDSLYDKLSERLSSPIVRIDFNALLSKNSKNLSSTRRVLLDRNSVAIGLALRGKATWN